MNCTFSQDYIYKGVAVLDAEGNKCKLRTAKDVARIILAQARGWNRRYNQLKEELVWKGFLPPFKSLKIESQLLIDDFVDNMIVVSMNFYFYYIVKVNRRYYYHHYDH